MPPPKAALSESGGFSFSGRIAIDSQGRQFHAGLSWLHAAHADEILVSGPLGQGLAELRRDINGASLKMANGAERRAADWQDLAQALFDVPLPVDDLAAWVQGRASAATRDAQGRPQSLQQGAWHVEWLEYANELSTAPPRLIEVRGPGISVRLRIDEWESGVRP